MDLGSLHGFRVIAVCDPREFDEARLECEICGRVVYSPNDLGADGNTLITFLLAAVQHRVDCPLPHVCCWHEASHHPSDISRMCCQCYAAQGRREP